MFYVLYRRMRRSLGSFTFFIKERGILCILLCSLEKNVAFFAFFYVLYKRMQKNAKERCALFGFISHKKMIESRKKKNVKERSVLYIRLKKNLTFFFAIYMYISIYIYIYLYISIYIIYIYLYIYICSIYIY